MLETRECSVTIKSLKICYICKQKVNIAATPSLIKYQIAFIVYATAHLQGLSHDKASKLKFKFILLQTALDIRADSMNDRIVSRTLRSWLCSVHSLR